MRFRRLQFLILGGIIALPVHSRAASGAYVFPGAPADFSGLFDGTSAGGSSGLGPPSAFKPAGFSALLRSERPEAPTVSFNGLELKTFLFSSQPEKIADSLTAAIQKTQGSLWAALYGLNLPEAADALIEAKNRGVDVKVIADYKHVVPDVPGELRSRELDRLIEAGVNIKVLSGAGAHGIMHNKFALFDGRLLETGSFNWNTVANTRHYENAIFRADQSLIVGFGEYWKWMWDQAKELDKAAELGELRGFPPTEGNPSLVFKGQAWPSFTFSPQGGAEEQIVKAIRLCRRRIDIAMFSFTAQKIGDALLDAKGRGVAVRLVIDRSQSRSPSSLTRFFSENNFDFKLLSGIGGQGVLHHKFGVFDGELLETGSYNYTLNGNLNNFENLVFSTRPEDLAGYQAEFDFLYGLGEPPSVEDMPPPAGAEPSRLPDSSPF